MEDQASCPRCSERKQRWPKPTRDTHRRAHHHQAGLLRTDRHLTTAEQQTTPPHEGLETSVTIIQKKTIQTAECDRHTPPPPAQAVEPVCFFFVGMYVGGESTQGPPKCRSAFRRSTQLERQLSIMFMHSNLYLAPAPTQLTLPYSRTPSTPSAQGRAARTAPRSPEGRSGG